MDRTALEVSVDALLASEEAMTWLHGRGLSWEAIYENQLGYVPVTDDSRFRHCVTIPYFDAMGRFRFMRYRHLRADARSKYETPKGAGRHLFNVAGTNAARVAICEGEFDAMILRQVGLEAVAIPGAQTWQREWRWLFRNTDLVYVVMDRDEEGIKAGAKVSAQVGQVTEVELIELPEGNDVTDLFIRDPDELRRLLT